MVGTPWILIGCYFTVALPFMYRAITNNLQAINLRDLMDAAQLLGASTFQAAVLVVLPNLRKGLMIALLLSTESLSVYLSACSRESRYLNSRRPAMTPEFPFRNNPPVP